jgi:hypothetical protein
MMHITRLYLDDCTIGVLEVDGLRCFTLELEDFDNEVGISCIPEGAYRVNKHYSEKLGACFNIQDVDGRTYIRIHSGNYTRQIQGCVLVGSSLMDIDKDGIIDVGNSKATLNKLLELLPDEFDLRIE